MKRILKDYRLHEHTEALFLLSLGIIIQVLDGSLFDVWDRWSLAWETEFPREFFSLFIQQIIKTVLSIIILIRCLTTVLYVLSGVITIYCILRETSPKLMLPWLFISGVKSVLLTFLETLTGVYVCSAFGKVRKPCIEFVVSKAIELFFAIYLWACIRSIHTDFEQFEEHYREEELLTKMVIHRVNLRRRRARSMIDESTLLKTSNLNYFGLKDVPNIIFDMLKTEDELSQDSLLSAGMMLASVSNMGSYDCLKTSLSLGELGVIDLNSFQVAGLDDYRHLSPSERAMKFLKLTRDDIRKAKERTRSNTFADNYRAPENVPRSLAEVKPSTVLNRLPRQNQVFAAQLPELDKVKEHLSMKKNRQRFQGDIFSDIRDFTMYPQVETRPSAEQLVGPQDGDGDEEEEEENGTNAMTEETDGETTPNLWFMTNIKDRVNRIGLVEAHNSKRSGNYERLYRQDFMNVIGAEVFDNANRLVKLTSLGDVSSSRGNYENELVRTCPSTSQDDSESHESVEEVIQARKSVKNKKLAFEGHFDSSTAMPLSVIVTNFPIQFDSKIRKCEAVYLREMVTESTEMLIPDRAIEPHLENCGGTSSSEMEEKMSVDDRQMSEENKFRGTFAQADDMRNDKKVNLLMLKCSRGTTPDFCYDQSGQLNEPKLLTCGGPSSSWDLALKNGQEPPLIRSSCVIDEMYDGSYTYPRISEQMMFISDLMKRPIADVLKYYYNLREAECEHAGLKRICSSDSVRFENGLTKKTISRLDRVNNPPEGMETTLPRIKSNIYLLSLEKTFADSETQASIGEYGVRSTETVTLENPKTKKLKTNENDNLPPLYLFGNKDLGWSSSPLDVRFDETGAHFKNNRSLDAENLENTGESTMSALSLGDGSTEKPSTLKTSNVSRKVMAPPIQGNLLSNDCFSSAQDQLSMEVISTTDDNNQSVCSTESDESFSLFYSKTADLASPLLDMRRFIYLDHIHYSYKNVKKKGFDVELNGGLPLLVRDSLTLDPTMNMKRVVTPPDPETGITRRPMDLTFANPGEFSIQEKQPEPSTSRIGDDDKVVLDHFEIPKLSTDPVHEMKPRSKTVKKEQKWLRKFLRKEQMRKSDDFNRELINTSSMNLHSNKGRVGVLSNPAVVLQSNKLKKKLLRSRSKNIAGRF